MVQMSNAVKYTGKLDVKYQIQQRQLRTAHEDDHYCLALFKIQRSMSVELSAYRGPGFVCQDDKAFRRGQGGDFYWCP